jgi:hypothetical protein
MDKATLAGCHAKVDRAEEAIDRMAQEWVTWRESNPYPTRVQADDATGEHHVFFDFSTPAPLRFPVLLGEIAHDLRSALDHLVWREAVEHVGRKRAEKNAGKITFPICRTRIDFAASKVKPFVTSDAWKLIERHQPYDRGKPPRPKTLGMLHWINRVDKHRLLHGSSVFLTFYNPAKLIAWDLDARLVAAPLANAALNRPLKHETLVASYQFDPTRPEPHVRVIATPSLSIGYGNSPPHLRRVEITHTAEKVRQIVQDFGSLIRTK